MSAHAERPTWRAPRFRCRRCRSWLGPTHEFVDRASATMFLFSLIAMRCAVHQAGITELLVYALLHREEAFASGQCTDCAGCSAEIGVVLDAIPRSPDIKEPLHRLKAAASELAAALAPCCEAFRKELEQAAQVLAHEAVRGAAEPAQAVPS